MKDPRLLLGLAFLLAAPPLLAQDHHELNDPERSSPLRVYAELESWRTQRGESWRVELDRATGLAEFLYGGSAQAAFEPSSDADFFSVARLFAEETQALHGIESVTLVEDRVLMLPLGLVGSSDKMTVRFRQEVRGVPVLDGWLNVLTDLHGNLLSVQTTALPSVADRSTSPSIDAQRASRTAIAAFVQRVGQQPTRVSPAVLGMAGVMRDEQRYSHLVWEVDVQWYVDGHSPAGTTYRVDAHSGQIVDERASVHHFDVGGTVSAMATPGTLPDIGSNPPVSEVMPFLRVQSSAGTILTDINGNFNYPGVSGPLSCTFRFIGPFADVRNNAGSEYSLVQSLSGTSNSVLMNPTSSGLITAQANAFSELVRLRNWIRAVNPADNTADIVAVANCNLSSTCNAFFNGSSVNFYQAGGGCVNTSYSSVIAHEMGHWLNVRYGTGNGSDGMGEGNADVFAMYLYDDPVVGKNFTTSGGAIRTGTNTRQFCGDCCSNCYGSGVHVNGEPWMGAAWKVRTQLKNANGPQLGGAIADALFLGWMNAYNQTQIKSIIEIQWLTLDDDNGNIDDGTPNYAAIDAGFRQQGFPGYELAFVSFANVTALPDTQNQIGPYLVQANITANLFPPITSATLRYRVNGGAYQNMNMAVSRGRSRSSVYEAAIPGVMAPAILDYYITATDSNGNSGSYPNGAPADTQSFFVGEVNVLYFNDFEGQSDEGWTHGSFGDTSNNHDDFQRGFTFGKGGDPSSAASGFRVWGNDLGPSGWNGYYQHNQHNWLRSPLIPTGDGQITLLRFKRWLTVERGIADQAILRVNNTVVWSNALNQDHVDTAWIPVQYDITSIASSASNIQIQFSLKSNGSVWFGGWTIDDVEVVSIGGALCDPPVNYGFGKINSLGLEASLGWLGTPSVAANDLRVTMAGALPNTSAVLFSGPTAAFTPAFGGFLLVGSPLVRETIFTTDASGAADVAVGVTVPTAGTNRFYQVWYRDNPDPHGVGLSNGMRVEYCP